jgi:hypothetical protein
MLSRRIPSPTPGAVKNPSSSGPRCRSEFVIARNGAVRSAVASLLTNPAMPHMKKEKKELTLDRER